MDGMRRNIIRLGDRRALGRDGVTKSEKAAGRPKREQMNANFKAKETGSGEEGAGEASGRATGRLPRSRSGYARAKG